MSTDIGPRSLKFLFKSAIQISWILTLTKYYGYPCTYPLKKRKACYVLVDGACSSANPNSHSAVRVERVESADSANIVACLECDSIIVVDVDVQIID